MKIAYVICRILGYVLGGAGLAVYVTHQNEKLAMGLIVLGFVTFCLAYVFFFLARLFPPRPPRGKDGR